MARFRGYVDRTSLSSATNRSGAGSNAPKYPHPFFDQGQSYLPTTYKNLFHWCRFYYLTTPVINSAIHKMAEYPITPIVFKMEDADLRDRYRELTNSLDLKSFRIAVGLDYFTYGNAYVSVMYPFRKYLVCDQCKYEHDIKDPHLRWEWRGDRFLLDQCPHCGARGFAKGKDRYIRSVRDIKLKRWSPEDIEVIHDEVNNHTEYQYSIPTKLSNQIRMGKRDLLIRTPQIFIDAVVKKKKIGFNPNGLLHLKRPSISHRQNGYGTPLPMPVLKDLHYLGILRRSQEAIAQEHIVPLRIVFPQGADPNASPYEFVDLNDWKQEISTQISQWKIDPNRIPIMPLPVGVQTIGGQGRALIFHQEYRVWLENIATGMGVPPEFIFGGISYSGTNLTMFQLHNKFLSYIEDQEDMVFKFILGGIADYMGWPRPRGSFRPFKMADDLQRSMLYFQLAQAQKISDATLLEDLGMDPAEERARMEAERAETQELQRRFQLQQAHTQGSIMLINQQYQMNAQKSMQAQMAPPPQLGMEDPMAGGMAPVEGDPGMEQQGMEQAPQESTMEQMAKRLAAKVGELEPAEQIKALNQIERANMELAKLVQGFLLEKQGQQKEGLDATQMPAPKQKPPRREAIRSLG